MSATSQVQHRSNPVSRHPIAAVVMLAAFVLAMVTPREVLAQKGSGTSRSLYQAYLASGCVAGSNFCQFDSEEVPARGLLEIQRVACQGWHTGIQPPSYVVMAELRTSDNTFVGRIDFLRATHELVSWGSTFTISEQALMFIPAGHKLRITLNSGTIGVGSYGCTISGYLTIS